jgi:thiol peroxidase
MAQITLKGNPVHTAGTLPAVGSKAPAFTVAKTDLADISLKDFAGKKLVLNIFPSIDTPTCATSVRKFNADATNLSNVAILCVSADLPFALKRFCGAEGLDKVTPASDFRDGNFGNAYGARITDGPLKGLLSRAVVVVDETGNVVYNEQVSEIADEPNYDKALAALK